MTDEQMLLYVEARVALPRGVRLRSFIQRDGRIRLEGWWQGYNKVAVVVVPLGDRRQWRMIPTAIWRLQAMLGLADPERPPGVFFEFAPR